jgi:hypothetical protein
VSCTLCVALCVVSCVVVCCVVSCVVGCALCVVCAGNYPLSLCSFNIRCVDLSLFENGF